MRTEFVVKSRTLTGSSDLTLIAPIKAGLVPSLDTLTYKTRVKRLLKTLQGGRASMHEYALYRPISDAVERVAKIHSFRVAIIEPENKVLLAVTFDGTWESYIRVLWQKVGSLLDVIFCNTDGYVVSRDNGFEAWAEWVHKVQIETAFFFNTHALTVDDVRFLRDEELIHRKSRPSVPACADQREDVEAIRHHNPTPEETAARAIGATDATRMEGLRQGLQSLAVLFRLTDMYLPRTHDGYILQRAARDILLEFVAVASNRNLPDELREGMRRRFSRQLDWLLPNDTAQVTEPKQVPALPAKAQVNNPEHVQGGILNAYSDVTHGCLLLIAFDARDAAAGILDELIGKLTRATSQPVPGRPTVNVALTYEGLRFLGMPEQQLAWFPQEFREGMELRASMLGDVRTNHPRRWRLLPRNWLVDPAQQGPGFELSSVHLMVQLRIGATCQVPDDHNNPAHPLHAEIRKLVNVAGQDALRRGIRLASVQPMQRYMHGNPSQVFEHFGFADGDGQPVLDAVPEGAVYPNQVHLGEILLGYDTEADFAPVPANDAQRERLEFLSNGSFLVVRKLKQYVPALNEVVRKASAATGLSEDLIFAKMMGRFKNGDPITSPGSGNDFHYGDDKNASKCPFHAHVRRANPRQIELGVGEPPGRRRPRIMRRGMSYGPPYDSAQAPADVAAEPDRGLVFMAYNASISEQFEVIQRWIAGGNSTGGFSGQSDPFLGVPEVGQQRHFRFEHEVDGQTCSFRMALDSAPELNQDPEPFVQLEWGAYLFVPSVVALSKLMNLAAFGPRPVPAWSADNGADLIQDLLRKDETRTENEAIRAWKSVLEDPEAQEKFVSAGVWAAIRERHGGVLRTPYGALVADRELVMQVLGDERGHFTVNGYRERMQGSIGQIYLGLDKSGDGEYERQSREVNRVIGDITEEDAFELAYAFTAGALKKFIDAEKGLASLLKWARWELNLDVKEVCDAVLARLCQHWFGLPADRDGPIVPGSWRWDWRDDQPSIYPSHFTAPSRYIFQPRPGDQVRSFGALYGAALTTAMTKFVAPFRRANTVPQTPDKKDAALAAAILCAFPASATDDFVARTFVGALMGMLPTVDGNLRLSLNEWLRDGSFWSLRAACAQRADLSAYERADLLLRSPLIEAMQLRPSPELVWRTVKGHGVRIGNQTLADGEIVVLSLVSATQQCLREGRSDVSPIFGGERTRHGPHPTHACPGYKAGMGLLLGMLGAMADVKEIMRASPAPLAFSFEGRTRT